MAPQVELVYPVTRDNKENTEKKVHKAGMVDQGLQDLLAHMAPKVSEVKQALQAQSEEMDKWGCEDSLDLMDQSDRQEKTEIRETWDRQERKDLKGPKVRLVYLAHLVHKDCAVSQVQLDLLAKGVHPETWEDKEERVRMVHWDCKDWLGLQVRKDCQALLARKEIVVITV